MRHGCFKPGGNLWRWVIVGLVVFGMLGWIGLEHFTAYAHLAMVQAKKLTVRGKPAVQLLIQTDQGAGKEIVVQVGSNKITFRTDSRGWVDTGHMEVPKGATSVVVKMPQPGDDLWPAECTIPLAEIPWNRYQRPCACMDLEPPITRFSQEPEKNRYGWNNSPVEVTLSATDEKSGVKQICYELSGAISQLERCVEGDQVSFTIPESPNGTTTVKFFAEDRWVDRGTPKPNREEPKTEVVRIDTGRPSISASLSPEPNEHGWNNEPVHISFHCSDSLSGIASCTGDRTVSTEGARQAVTGHATDRAGNANSTTVYVNIDLTKPVIRQVGSATCSQPGNNGWCRGKVTVPFEASDALSGFAGGEHTIRFTKSTSREGEAVYVSSGTVEDLAGNAADPISAGPFKIDHTPPSINLSASSPQPGEPAVVSWEVTDGLSGVDQGSCLVTISGPGITRALLSTECHGQTRLTYEQYGAGEFTVRVEARDLAGNEGSEETPVSIPPPLGRRVLIYYGNGGASPEIEEGGARTYQRLKSHYESYGLPTTYTDEWPETLTEFCLIILPTPGTTEDDESNFYTSSQVNALKAFLRTGGRLLILGDHSGKFGINTVNDLLAKLGVGISQNADAFLDGFDSTPTTNITADPLMDGVTSLQFAASSSLNVSGTAKSLAREPGGATLIAVDRGAGGEVVVSGDSNFIDDSWFSDGDGDNLRFIDNLVAGYTGGPQTSTIQGKVVDATTNDPLAGAKASLSPTGRTTSTAGDGRFSFTELGPRTYTVTAEDSGYSPSSREVTCRAGETAEVVLALSPLGEWRIVLSWGADPEDLDSHLWTPDGEHIWYDDPLGENADLDVDVTASYGPKTITIHRLVEGTYVYAVKHYEGSGNLAHSEAQVEVYSPTGLVQRFTNPPCGTGVGTWWVVFKLHVAHGHVEIERINRCLERFDEESATPPGP